MLKKLLLTGFEPFLDHSINPTERMVNELNGRSRGRYNIVGKVLPVTYKKASEVLLKTFEDQKPEAVIMLGLAAGRNRITPERIAINIDDGLKDNEGVSRQDTRIVKEGPDGYFSTLPIRNIVDALNNKGIPATVSNTAGTYLCNHVMYQMLHYLASKGLKKDVQAGFVHLPASHELAVERESLPSMSHLDLVTATLVMIDELT